MKILSDDMLLNGGKKTVLFFCAEWCSPCKLMEPAFLQLEPEFPEIDFIKVDIEKNPTVTQQFDIGNVPTTIVLSPNVEASLLLKTKSKQNVRVETARLVGARHKESIREALV